MTQWWSQKFAAEGAAAAEGIAKQLGKPELDPLTILVREAAQNSWDARESPCVEFTLDLHRLGDRAEAWRGVLGSGPVAEAGVPIGGILTPDSYVLVISDRGTRGLGGPLRADKQPAVGEVADFVQFLRNVGESSDHKFGGGTYGFGKGILYAASRVGTILVDTHAMHGSGASRRLMASALGKSFHAGDGTRFTGRHWWGRVNDNVPDPVVESEAADVSEALGLPGFADGRFGTDIVVLGFDCGSLNGLGNVARPRTPREAGEFLASSLLWHLWPKMGSARRPPGMEFRVSVDGEDIALPDPSTTPFLAGFVHALDELHAGNGIDYTRSVAPRFAGSTFVTRHAGDPSFGAPASAIVQAAMPFSPPFRHVCCMRTPELVINYLPREAHPDQRMGYSGVFRSSEEADSIFAESETPTHDAWVSTGLSGASRGVVTGLRGRIDQAVAMILPKEPATKSVSVEGVGRVSNAMASLVPSISGTGASLPEDNNRVRRPGASGSKATLRAHIVVNPRVVVDETGPFIQAVVRTPKTAVATTVHARASVVISGGTEKPDEAPLNAKSPRVLSWASKSTGRTVYGSALPIPAEADTDEWTVTIAHVPGVVVRLTVDCEAEASHG
ncbi:hypothetical protein [Micrococcus luteus]|uniref:hypothetical protein n=1 Tax=Micrococcus luteus TaxID=1270 RepID=UPI002A67856A|nr:hypothetical protein [Micrococcus luteus]MCV7652093.1 hypothetical protein [Micrococcus luteus]